MFFQSKKKDEEILRLKERVSELEAQQNHEDLILEEINNVLLKFEKGFFGITIKNSTQNEKLNKIKETLNNALKRNSELADRSIQTLIEYGNANFNYEINTEGLCGKIGSIILGTKAIGSTVSELLALMDTTSEELYSQVGDLTAASNSLAISSNQQAASLEETAAALEEVTSTIINTNINTEQMAKLSQEVNISATKGEELAKNTVISMNNINDEVSLIEEATRMIDQISFQTNILSLNAAVEAATAGEAGKGFAVVAAEVRNLANRSSDAAKEINAIVQKAKQRANEGKETAQDMINGYEILNSNIENQIKIINEVSNASKEQRAAIEQINDAVTQLDQSTQQNAAAASQINSQSTNIENLAKKLVDVINNTTYIEESKKQISDVDLLFTINRLKLDHINFKDSNYKELYTEKKWTVKKETECNLGKWILEQEMNNKEFTKTSNWQRLKDYHVQVHGGVQNIVDCNADNIIDEMLTKTFDIDKAIIEVFSTMQNVKIENAQNC